MASINHNLCHTCCCIAVALAIATLPARAWNVGIEVPLWEDYASRVFSLQAQPRQQLLNRLQDLQQRGYMFGHQDDPFYGVNWQWEQGRSDVLETCGDYPAVMGFDLGGIEVGDAKNLDSVPFARIREELLAHVRRGGIATVSWHPRNPLTGGTAWDVSDSSVVSSILPGGRRHEKFSEWMQRVSAFLQSLRDEHGQAVPVIFRPLHENNGSWFWWGKALCTPDEYKVLWRMLQDHLIADGLTNLVWSWSPNLGLLPDDLDTYPGDDSVDIIGPVPGTQTATDFRNMISSKNILMLKDIQHEHIQ